MLPKILFTPRNLLGMAITLLFLTSCATSTPIESGPNGTPEIPQTSPSSEEAPSPTPPALEATPTSTLAAIPSPTDASTASSNGEWIELAPMNIPRAEMPAVVYNGKIYTIGGLLDGSGLRGTAESEIYDPTTNTWTPMTPLPAIRHHGMATEFEGRIYYFGGADADTLNGNVEAWVYNPELDTWTPIASLPEPRASGWAGTVGDFIYVLGGTGNNVGNARVLRYDPATDTWERLSSIPENREHIAGTVLDGQIYILGGRWAQGAREYKSVLIYDPETDSWATSQPMLDNRTGFPATVLDGKVYVFGGELFMTVSPGVALDSAEVFDPATNTWTYLPPMPASLHGMPAVTVGHLVYVIGGSNIAARASNVGHLYTFQP